MSMMTMRIKNQTLIFRWPDREVKITGDPSSLMVQDKRRSLLVHVRVDGFPYISTPPPFFENLGESNRRSTFSSRVFFMDPAKHFLLGKEKEEGPLLTLQMDPHPHKTDGTWLLTLEGHIGLGRKRLCLELRQRTGVASFTGHAKA